MGLLNSIFGNNPSTEKSEKQELPWIPLTSLEQLAEIEKKSHQKTQIIFKHSTTCGVSRMVINSFRSNYPLTAEQADLYYLDLHNFRDVSNETGYRFQVIHQSPQVLVIRNGKSVADASHAAISGMNLLRFV